MKRTTLDGLQFILTWSVSKPTRRSYLGVPDA